ncbi:T3SS effector HopA1 family protein [Pseudomonas citri]|uniref:T3SS effector HopA1 family protein n=1 Tax=Pseudomonas citri TaxID=2978349 RepID=UPI0021B60A8D|nr:T3SS effector HopA1 family protein [Pseudomonas citri]
MNPLQFRFSRVEAPPSSPVDSPDPKAEGQIEAGGKSYRIRSSVDGQPGVERSDTQGSFFKSVTALLFGENAKDKRPSPPRQEPVTEGRFQLNPLILEQGQGSRSVVEVKEQGTPDGKPVFAGLHEWAQKAEQLKPPVAMRDIYTLYLDDNPKVQLLQPTEKKAVLDELVRLDREDGVDITPQSFDTMPPQYRRVVTLDRLIQGHPDPGMEFYRFEPKGRTNNEESTGRLTVNIEPRYSGELARALATFVKSEKIIVAAKIAGPSEMGARPDSAVLHIKGDYASTQALGRKFQALLPPDALIDHAPAGMQPLGKGLYYAETMKNDSSSHGISRAMLIETALKDQSGGSLESRLKKAIAERGYNPDNPAFRMPSA